MNTSSLRGIFATVAGILGTLAIAIYIAGGIVQTASSAEKKPCDNVVAAPAVILSKYGRAWAG